jgi:hypothetical protein
MNASDSSSKKPTLTPAHDLGSVLTGLVFSLPKNSGLQSWISYESATLAADGLRESYASLSELEWRLHYLARDLESAFPEKFRNEDI